MTRKDILTLSIFLIFFTSVSVFSNTTLSLDESEPVLILGKYFCYMEDKSGTLTIKEIAENLNEDAWIPMQQDTLSVGLTKSVYWLRFTMKNTSDRPVTRYLENVDTTTHLIELYTSKGQSYHIQRTGAHIKFSERPYKYLLLAIPIVLEPGESRTYYVRQKMNKMNLTYVLRSEDQIRQTTIFIYVFTTLAIGIFLALILYHLILFFFIKHIEYLIYVTLVFLWLVSSLTFSGLSSQVIWPNIPILSPIIYFFSYFLIPVFIILFVLIQLNMRRDTPRLFFTGIILIIANIVSSVICFVISNRFVDPLVPLLSISLNIFILISAIYLVIKKNRTAYFILIASVLYIVSNTFYALATSGFIPFTELLDFAPSAGKIIFVISYALSLADKINTMRSELTQLNLNLEEKVKTRTRDLEDANNKLLEMDKIKSDFFANISHEIRTPLTMILSPIEAVLNKSFKGKIDDNFFSILRKNAVRLLRLINNLLDFSRLDSHKMELKIEKIDIVTFISRYLETISSTIHQKSITIDFKPNHDSLEIDADIEKIYTVITNIISNAIKFTDEQGKILITIDLIHNNVVIKVKDSGIGIPEDKISTIFDRFVQVDSGSTRKYEGTGIGLALSMELVKLHRGSISVTSKHIESHPDDHGSIFTISLPRHTEYQDKNHMVPKSYQHTSGQDSFSRFVGSRNTLNTIDYRSIGTEKGDEDLTSQEIKIIPGRPGILIAEDNRDLLMYLASNINAEYNVYSATNGRHALEILTKIAPPNIIISDIMMPEMDGIRFYQEVSARENLSSIPFIFLTARADDDEKIKSLKKGAFDYIYKPFSMREIMAKIKSFIKNQELQARIHINDKFTTLGMLTGGLFHEILNPLNIIYGTIDLLELEAGSSEQVELYCNRIVDNVGRIEKIIKNLKGLSDHDSMVMHDIDMIRLVKSVTEEFTNQFTKKIHFDISIQEEVMISGLEEPVRIILKNLISNAVDAIEQEGNVRIRVTKNREGNHISIKDTGKGIAPGKKQFIFNAFYTDKEVGKGMGLGLYVVHNLIEKLGWKIDIHSEKDAGTEVIIKTGETDQKPLSPWIFKG